mmetsp:Transcript_14688/g.28957  ORF Transcript_14688/g.28957 Transcript_14688/m.28957 type:complete len:228 (-) Transcript_14688:31-714(-)
MTLSQKFWPSSGNAAEFERTTAQFWLAWLPTSGCQRSALPLPSFSSTVLEGALMARTGILLTRASLAEDSRLGKHSQISLGRQAIRSGASPTETHIPCSGLTSRCSRNSLATMLRSVCNGAAGPPYEASCSVLSTLCNIPSASKRASRLASNSALSPERDAPRSFACTRASSPVVSSSCCFIHSKRLNSCSSWSPSITQPRAPLESRVVSIQPFKDRTNFQGKMPAL